MRNLVILGATGSIGTSALDVVAGLSGRLRVVGLACRREWRALAELAARWRPDAVAVEDEAAWKEARAAGAFPSGVRLLAGVEGVCEVAALEAADLVLNGVVGAVGLLPTLAALDAGKCVALANKESLVVGGELVMERAREPGRLLPVDSEHSAIWRLLEGCDPARVARVILTASGGPFRAMPRSRLAAVTPREALDHPTWSMGPKITVDSATLANKGLEVIEAHHLFGLPYERIDVVIHPQSIVHGLVETVDGALFAELGPPDMRTPIRAALTWPERVPVESRADLTAFGDLSFERPDPDRFPALSLAREAGQAGGTAPTVFNAANEVAVAAFLAGEAGFLDIAGICERALAEHEPAPARSVEALMEADAWARRRASDLVRARTRAATVG